MKFLVEIQSFLLKAKIKILLIHIAENNDTIIHIANINQNHLIILTQNINNINEIISHVTFESHIADHDFSNQILDELIILFHCFNSSLILSKINILASIAIPIDSINPAIEANVNVTHKNLIIDNVITIYNINAIEATNQDNLYITNKNTNINKNHNNHAIINFSKELVHNFESITLSEVRYIGAGTTQVLILLAND